MCIGYCFWLKTIYIYRSQGPEHLLLMILQWISNGYSFRLISRIYSLLNSCILMGVNAVYQWKSIIKLAHLVENDIFLIQLVLRYISSSSFWKPILCIWPFLHLHWWISILLSTYFYLSSQRNTLKFKSSSALLIFLIV